MFKELMNIRNPAKAMYVRSLEQLGTRRPLPSYSPKGGNITPPKPVKEIVYMKDITINIDTNKIQEMIEEKIKQLTELQSGVNKDAQSLLVIQLDKFGDVPKVFYKGEELKGKVSISFDWETKTDKEPGKTNIELVYAQLEDKGNPSIRTIGYSAL